MTVAQKVALVRAIPEEYPVTSALSVLGLSRSTWYYQAGRVGYADGYASLQEPLEAIARRHSEYGYRRATTELQETYGYDVNHKVVQRLNRLWGLPLARAVRPPRASAVRTVITAAADRANLLTGLESIGPFEVAYTDFTQLRYARGEAWLIAILDHVTKSLLGWALDEQRTTEVALRAWAMARCRLRRWGALSGLILHHDQDPVFTSYDWVRRLLVHDRVRLSYALNGAKDNPEMESFNSRFKNENRSLLLEAASIRELRQVVHGRLRYYDRERRHSALGNRSPHQVRGALRAANDKGKTRTSQ